MLPRSYKIPKGKAPFVNAKKDNYEFAKGGHQFMTKVGQMLLNKNVSRYER